MSKQQAKRRSMWDAIFTGGVIHGVALAASTAFAEPNSVLPAFVTALSPARWLVGAVSAVLIGGQVLLQVVFAYFLQGQARRQPYLLGAVFVRASSWAILGAVIATRTLAMAPSSPFSSPSSHFSRRRVAWGAWLSPMSSAGRSRH